MDPNGKDFSPFFLPEDNDGTISFNAGDIIHLACPGSNVTLNSEVQNFVTTPAVCVSDSTFSIQNVNILFSQVSCTEYARHIARYNGKTCQSKYKEFEIGFDLETRFLVHIVGCFDDVNQITLYTWFNLTSTIGGSQTNVARPSFTEGDFYHVGSYDVNTLYIRTVQRKTINKMLGLNNTSTKYIQNSNNYYLARGHLTAKTDFVYGAQQRLTFYFVNAAPQWQTFNAGNWERLESNVKTYANGQNSDLLVYTGTYGVTTLPHETTKEDTELYLYVDANANKAIPVPHLFWKFVYDTANKAGAVFVGVNNPYQNATKKICTDHSKEISWLTWKPDDQVKGFSYVCSYADFKSVVHYLPDVEVKSLLT